MLEKANAESGNASKKQSYEKRSTDRNGLGSHFCRMFYESNESKSVLNLVRTFTRKSGQCCTEKTGLCTECPI